MKAGCLIACAALILGLSLVACASGTDLPAIPSSQSTAAETASASRQPPTRTPFQPRPPGAETATQLPANAVENAPTATGISPLASGDTVWIAAYLPDALQAIGKVVLRM